MKIYKGTVFKVKPNTLIVMTGDFEFKEIQSQKHARVGMEITFHQRDIIEPGRGRMIALAASLIIFILFSSNIYNIFMTPKVYAYVSIDINPSIELTVDKKMNVIAAESRNSGGDDILHEQKLNGLHLENAIKTVIKISSERGYINHDACSIMITTTIVSDKNDNKEEQELLDQKLLSITRAELERDENNYSPEVYIVQAQPAERQQALDNGVSTGRYILWEKVKESNPDIVLEQISSKEIGTVMKEHANVKSVIAESASARWEKGLPPGLVKRNEGLTPKNERNNNHPKITEVQNKPAIDKKDNNNKKNNNNRKNTHKDELPPGIVKKLDKDKMPPGLDKDKMPPGIKKKSNADRLPPGLSNKTETPVAKHGSKKEVQRTEPKEKAQFKSPSDTHQKPDKKKFKTNNNLPLGIQKLKDKDRLPPGLHKKSNSKENN